MNNAATEGHLDVVKWLHEHRAEGCTTHAMDRTAAILKSLNGSMKIVQRDAPQVRWTEQDRLR
uniref:Uncharacterized protein n=1 Tax=Globisporangium ultimum (strain ATCC 200006 / CBS 805.95 / DAOM BR144) TaxID=431595 RepID=K3WP09_GLOUD